MLQAWTEVYYRRQTNEPFPIIDIDLWYLKNTVEFSLNCIHMGTFYGSSFADFLPKLRYGLTRGSIYTKVIQFFENFFFSGFFP